MSYGYRTIVIILLITLCCPSQPALAGAPPSASLPALHDVTISLYSNPIKPEDRAPYEAIIRRFADGVYEASNGAHKIRTVSIYANGRYADKADIVWVKSCWPSGSISGRGTPGLHINFCDEFDGTNFLTSSDGAEGGGYTLAHEWGHYFYSLYDEYRSGTVAHNAAFHFPHTDDDPVDQSIMNRQWNAIGGDYEWLNFSTENSIHIKTAQYRVYQASAWETLTREVSEDPRDGQRSALPVRLYYPELAQVAPDEDEEPEIDLPEPDARSDLKIVWVTEYISFQIVIDHSGSMEDEGKMASARVAARLLIDLAEPGMTSIGIIQFDDGVNVLAPLTPVTTESDKLYLKSIVSAIQPDGRTAIGEAAATALYELRSVDPALSNRGVFLLTDGLNNEGRDPLTVIPDYQAAGIPLFTFGYGSDVDVYSLQQMAAQTGGRFFFSTTGLADLAQVFQDASQNISPTISLDAASATIAEYSEQSFLFSVDETLDRLNVVVTFDADRADINLTAIAPNGANYSLENCEPTYYETLCLLSVENPQPGLWTLYTASGNYGFDLNYRAIGSANQSATYTATVASLGGDFVRYPEPIVLLATVGKGLPIRGAEAVGILEQPDGSQIEFTLRDDGVAPDVMADDGLYSAILDYAMSGTFNISVKFTVTTRAAQTDAGFAPAIARDGSTRQEPANIPVTENFTRYARTQVTVVDYAHDDHGDDAYSATILTADNVNIPGKMDFTQDVDAFAVTLRPSQALVVRISELALGMQPRLTVLAADGGTVLMETDLDKNAAAAGYLYLPLDFPDQNVIYLLVSSSGGAGGTYNISAGARLKGEGTAATQGLPGWLLPVIIAAGALLLIGLAVFLLRRRKLRPAPVPVQPGYPYTYPVQPQAPPAAYPQPQAQPSAPPAMVTHLLGVSLNVQNYTFPLTEGLIIGTAAHCGLRLADPLAAPLHAMIRFHHGRWHIQDMNSGRGTLLNNAWVAFAPLNPGDWVRLGGTDFTVR